jgi:hypothetical protein
MVGSMEIAIQETSGKKLHQKLFAPFGICGSAFGFSAFGFIMKRVKRDNGTPEKSSRKRARSGVDEVAAEAEQNLSFVMHILQRYEALSNFFVQSHLQLAGVVNSFNSALHLHRLHSEQIQRTIPNPSELLRRLEVNLSEIEQPCFDFLRSMEDSWRDCVEELNDIQYCCSEFVSRQSNVEIPGVLQESLTFDSQPVENVQETDLDLENQQNEVTSARLDNLTDDEKGSLEVFFAKQLSLSDGQIISIQRHYKSIFSKKVKSDIYPVVEFLSLEPLKLSFKEIGEMAVTYTQFLCLDVRKISQSVSHSTQSMSTF